MTTEAILELPVSVDEPPAPKVWEPNSAVMRDIVRILDMTAADSYLNDRYMGPDHLGIVRSSPSYGELGVRVYTPGEGANHFTVSKWEIVHKVEDNRPEVAVGDLVRILAPQDFSYFNNVSYYDPEELHEVTETFGGSITVNAVTSDGILREMNVAQWSKSSEPIRRPEVIVGMKVKVLNIAPKALLTDGALGNGVGVVVRTERNIRPTVRFASTEGVVSEHIVNEWEIVPFADIEDEFECFKIATYSVAKAYGKENSMCPVLDKALAELALLPNRRFKVEFEFQAGDIVGTPNLKQLLDLLNQKPFGRWPKGKITEVKSPKKQTKNKTA